MTHTIFGLFNLGGAEIILILAMLLMFVIAVALVLGGVFLIIRATRRPVNPPEATAPNTTNRN